MATDEQVDDMCRRLQGSRREIFEVAHRLKGDAPRTTDPNAFPRSRIMRALTGQQGRAVLRNAAVALAMSRPKTAWRLAGLAPLLRPMILRYLAQRILRPRRPSPTVTNRT
jgi:hypothetical protein